MLLLENVIGIKVLELGENLSSFISLASTIFVVISANRIPMQILGPSPTNDQSQNEKNLNK